MHAITSSLPCIRGTRRLLIFLSMMLIMSITPSAYAVGTVSIRGTVVDPLARPLASVTVTDGSNSVLTDASGYYQLEASGVGPFTITAGRTGLNAQSRIVSLTAALQPQDFQLSFWQSASNSPSLFNSLPKTVTLQTISYAPPQNLCAWAIDVRTSNTWIPLTLVESHLDGWHRFSASLNVPAGTTDGNYAVHYRLLDCTSGTALAPESIKFYQLDTVAPEILSFGSRPNPFSPNGDGVWDRSEIGAQLGEGAWWDLKILSVTGTLVSQASGFGSYASFSWDGKNASGVLQPAGQYQARLDAFDAAGNHEVQRIWVTLGSGPKILSLSTTEIEIGSKFSILGTGFGTSPLGRSSVSIDGVDLVINSWSDTVIEATVASGISPGTYDLSVWAAGVTSPSVKVQVKNTVSTSGGGFNLCNVEKEAQSCSTFNLTGYVGYKVRPGVNGHEVAEQRGNPGSRRAVPTSSDEKLSRWFRIPFKGSPEAADKLIDTYASDHRVEWAEYQGSYKLSSLPNDPLIGDQWALFSAGVASTTTASAWDFTRGDQRISIAVVDSGIGPHPDLDANILPGRDYSGSGTTSDGCSATAKGSHGTQVAGLAAAVAGNGIGIAGVAPSSMVRAYKNFKANAKGDCEWVTSTALAQVIDDAVTDGNQVINLSFTGPFYSQLDQDAIDRAFAKGVVVVAAAGNEATNTVFYPAALRHVISTGANADTSNQKAFFSNEGQWVDIYAPGAHLMTTVIDPVKGATYQTVTGTSFSAPIVSGVAALLKSCALSDLCRQRAGATSTVIDAASVASAITYSRLTNAREPIGAHRAITNMYKMSVRHPDGSFLKDRRGDRHTVYFLDRGAKRPISSNAVAASWGLYFKERERLNEQPGIPHNLQVVQIEAEELERYPTATVAGSTTTANLLGFRPGTLITPTGDLGNLGADIYAVTNDPENPAIDNSIDRWTKGTKRSVLALFGCLGYQLNNVFAVDPKLTEIHKTDPPVSSCSDHPNGTVMRETVDGKTRAWIKERHPDDPAKSSKRLVGTIDLGPNNYFLWSNWDQALGDRMLKSWGIQKAEVVANSFTDLQLADPNQMVAPGLAESPKGAIGYRPGTMLTEAWDRWWVVGIKRDLILDEWRGDFPRADVIRFTGDAWGADDKRGCYRYNGNAKIQVPVNVATSTHREKGWLDPC